MFTLIRNMIQQVVYRLLERPVHHLLRMGVTPNMVTTAGLIGNVAAAALLAWAAVCRQPDEMLWPAVAAAVMLLSSLMDMVDGFMARAGGLESRFGAFYDSVLDRYCELVTLCAIAFYLVQTGHPIGALLTFASLTGSIMVSYARARAEGLGIECKMGLMQRPERVVTTVAGLALAPLSGIASIVVSQAVIAVLANWTAWARIRHCRRQMR